MGGLGLLSGPPWAVWARCWGLCGWSWLALAASEGGLGQLSGVLRVILGRDRAAKWPRPKGSAWKVAQTRAGAGSEEGLWAVLPSEPPEPPEDSYGFILSLSIYIYIYIP